MQNPKQYLVNIGFKCLNYAKRSLEAKILLYSLSKYR